MTVADAASLDLTTGMTIEAWVNPTVGTGWRTVIAEGRRRRRWPTRCTPRTTPRARPASCTRSADVGLNGTAAVPLNTWTHLALTYDGATLRMFVNGVQVSTQRADRRVRPITPVALRIGGNRSGANTSKG